MATKTDLRSQPRGPADGTSEVTLVLLREQFQHSFVPRMSEDDTGIPMVSPKIAGARVTPSVTPGRMTPSIHDARTTPKIIGRMTPSITEAQVGEKKITGSRSSRIAFKVG